MIYREPDNDELNNREKGMERMRSITNYVMGILLVGAGCFFFFPNEEILKKYDLTVIRMFGILCFIYGLFRIYRGYKKNNFRNG